MLVCLLASTFPRFLLLSCSDPGANWHRCAEALHRTGLAFVSRSERSLVGEKAWEQEQLDACLPAGLNLSSLPLAVVLRSTCKLAQVCRGIVQDRPGFCEQVRAQLGWRENLGAGAAGCLFACWPQPFLASSCCRAQIQVQIGTGVQRHCTGAFCRPKHGFCRLRQWIPSLSLSHCTGQAWLL